jgi:hypothetical protein
MKNNSVFAEMILGVMQVFGKQLKPEKIAYLAKNNRCWYSSVFVLEQQLLGEKPMAKDCSSLYFSLRDVWNKLNEQEMVLG